MSDFELKKTTKRQSVNEKFSTHQSLNQRCYNVSDFEKKNCFRKITFEFILHRENDLFRNFL